jgi:hypothetical protein
MAIMSGGKLHGGPCLDVAEDIDAAVIALRPRYAFEGPLACGKCVGTFSVGPHISCSPTEKLSEPSAFIAVYAPRAPGRESGRGIRDYGDRDIREIQNEKPEDQSYESRR